MTYQRTDKGDYGVSYKLAFMPDENGTPERTCFQVDGTSENPVTIQSILPSLDGFQVCITYLKRKLIICAWVTNSVGQTLIV